MSERSSSSSSSSSSQTDGDLDGELDEEVKSRGGRSQDRPSAASFSASLLAVMRIKQKYQTLKKRRQELGLTPAEGLPFGAPERSSPKIFTFDSLTPSTHAAFPPPPNPQKKKKKRRRRVLFPTGGTRRAAPKGERSRATYCLYLLFGIVFLQVYNAIENLDDHVLRYDLEGLEKTLRREVYGQQGAVEGLLAHLKDYLSTYVHNKPLVLSVNGPTGVGKSHLGRLLAGHFRSVVGDALVLQYYVLHHCPLDADAPHCAHNLSSRITEMVDRAEEEEKIPLFVFDESEHLPVEMLDALWTLVTTRHANEYMNAIYLFLSSLGHEHVTKHMLHNSSRSAASLANELASVLRSALDKLHPLWAEAELVPLGLLEKCHVMECFLEEVTREGFYPDRANIERLAGEIEYFPAVGGHQFSQTGCKQVVAKVNLL